MTARLPPPGSFLREAEAFGIEFDPGDLDRLEAFLVLLLEAGKRFNLTAIKDPDQAWTRHVFDSLTLLPFVVAAEASRIIDVGSGGGLPGVPLAIALPRVEVTLLEATGKKARFLREVAAALPLANVVVINERAETIGQVREHREHYDAVVTRAVGPLTVALELAVPLARVGGHVLTIKGRAAEQEVKEAAGALKQLHCQIVEITRTPTGTIVAVEKRRKTPKRYPRRPGEPKRLPLGGHLRT